MRNTASLSATTGRLITTALLCTSLFDSAPLRAEQDLSLELGTGVLYTDNSSLLMLGLERDDGWLFGLRSYITTNVGAWSGDLGAANVGLAKGVTWNMGGWGYRLSSGVSLISNTSTHLSTAFQFYEQFLVSTSIAGHPVALSYRHWSNGNIKKPNYGVDFLGLETRMTW